MTTTMKTALTRFFPAPFLTGKTLIARLVELQAIHKERRALAEMDADRLADMGLSASEAEREARRPVWDAPERWLR